MTVKELIQKLQKYDLNLKVYLSDSEIGIDYEVSKVEKELVVVGLDKEDNSIKEIGIVIE